MIDINTEKHTPSIKIFGLLFMAILFLAASIFCTSEKDD